MVNKLKNIIMGFGETRLSPTKLSDAQINTLVKVIEDTSIDTKQLSGFITSDNGLKGSVAWLLGRYGVTYVGTLLVDGYTIGADKTSVYEGATVNLTADGVPMAALSFSVDAVSVSGDATEADVRAILSLEGNVLTVGKSSKTSGWTATVRIKATPVYDSSETHTVSLTVTGKARPTSITIGGEKKVSGLFNETLSTNLSIIYDVHPEEGDVTEIEIECDSQYVVISNKTVNGFTVSAQGRAERALITIKVHCLSNVLQATTLVNFALVPEITIDGETFVAINGECEQRFILGMTSYTVPVSITSVTTDNDNILVKDVDLTGFTLYSTAYKTDSAKVTITATFAVDGTSKVITKEITATNTDVILNFSMYKDDNWITGGSIVKIGELYPKYRGEGYWSVGKEVVNENTQVLEDETQTYANSNTSYSNGTSYNIFSYVTRSAKAIRVNFAADNYPNNFNVSDYPRDVTVQTIRQADSNSYYFEFSRELTSAEIQAIKVQSVASSAWKVLSFTFYAYMIPITIDGEVLFGFSGDKEVYSDGSERKEISITQNPSTYGYSYSVVTYAKDLAGLEVTRIEWQYKHNNTDTTKTYTSIDGYDNLGGNRQKTYTLPMVIPSDNSKYYYIDAGDNRYDTVGTLIIYYYESVYSPRPFSLAAVDLGLPSGLLWANANVGAEAKTDVGLLFQWGSLTGHTEDEGYDFSSSNYPESGITANLSLSQDAARHYMGGEWRMPTINDYSELTDNCFMEWTDDYDGTGQSGVIFYSCADNATGKAIYHGKRTWMKKLNYEYSDNYGSQKAPEGFVPYSLNTPHIFFPCNTSSGYSYYWTSQSSGYANRCAFGFSGTYLRAGYFSSGWNGHSIRAVM